MQETDKYIGKKYKFNGRTLDEFDCIGLLYLWGKEHGWNLDFSDGKLITHDWYEHSKYRMIRYLLKHMERIDISHARHGDVVLWSIADESHTGIYLGYNKVLTTYPNNISQIARLSLGSRFFVSFFRKAGD